MGFHSGFVVAATTPSKAEAKIQLKDLKKKIRKAKDNLQANSKRYNQAALELIKVEKEIAKISSELRSVEKKLAATGERLDRLKKQQKTLLNDKRSQKLALAKQIRAAYGNGKEEYIKLLLNQDDPAEFGRMLGYFEYLNKARSREINQITKTFKELAQVATEIAESKKTLSKLAQDGQQKIAQLQQQQQKRKAIATRWQMKVNQSDKRLTSLLANEKELQTIIDTVREAIEVYMANENLQGLGRLKRKLRWPIKGKMTSKFGSKRHLGQMRWKGVLIEAAEGKPVHSISSGRVVFADWLRGYGLLMIVDHGKKYMTLYGHNQTLLKSVGDWIEPGEVISLVGNTGGQAKSALYFEVRYKNKPVNPALWCR
jgi:septal ring factor EnvC (AmiA/AmiB activator)